MTLSVEVAGDEMSLLASNPAVTRVAASDSTEYFTFEVNIAVNLAISHFLILVGEQSHVA